MNTHTHIQVVLNLWLFIYWKLWWPWKMWFTTCTCTYDHCNGKKHPLAKLDLFNIHVICLTPMVIYLMAIIKTILNSCLIRFAMTYNGKFGLNCGHELRTNLYILPSIFPAIAESTFVLFFWTTELSKEIHKILEFDEVWWKSNNGMGIGMNIFTSDVHKIKVNWPSLITLCRVVLIYSVKK